MPVAVRPVAVVGRLMGKASAYGKTAHFGRRPRGPASGGEAKVEMESRSTSLQ